MLQFMHVDCRQLLHNAHATRQTNKKKWIIHHSELYYFAKFQNVASQNLLNLPNMNDFSLCNDFFFKRFLFLSLTRKKNVAQFSCKQSERRKTNESAELKWPIKSNWHYSVVIERNIIVIALIKKQKRNRDRERERGRNCNYLLILCLQY